MCFEQADHFFDRPNVVGQTRSSRRASSQRHVLSAPIVVERMDRKRGFHVVEFLAVGIRKPGPPALRHAEREIGPLNMTGGYVTGQRTTVDGLLLAADAR